MQLHDGREMDDVFKKSPEIFILVSRNIFGVNPDLLRLPRTSDFE